MALTCHGNWYLNGTILPPCPMLCVVVLPTLGQFFFFLVFSVFSYTLLATILTVVETEERVAAWLE